MPGQRPMSTTALAAAAGWAEPTMRRFLATEAGEVLAALPPPKNVAAARALKAGHPEAVISLIEREVTLKPSTWITSTSTESFLWPSLLHAAAYMDDHSATWVVTNMGAFMEGPT